MAKKRMANFGAKLGRDYGNVTVEFSVTFIEAEYISENDSKRKYGFIVSLLKDQIEEFERDTVKAFGLPDAIGTKQVSETTLQEYTLKEIVRSTERGEERYKAVTTSGQFMRFGVSIYPEIVDKYGLPELIDPATGIYEPLENETVKVTVDTSGKYNRVVRLDGGLFDNE